MTLDEHTSNNSKILSALENFFKDSSHSDKLYVWIQEMYALENGMYKSKGLLTLPLILGQDKYENYDEFRNKTNILSVFDKRFINGEGIAHREYIGMGEKKEMDYSRWTNLINNSKHLKEESVSKIYGVDTVMERENYSKPLKCINKHINSYFKLRRDLINIDPSKEDINEKSRAIALGCFMEY